MALKVISRTTMLAIPATNRPSLTQFDVLLLDTKGELADWYSVSTLVIIGKSLAAIGGQNPAEAIAAGRPVVFGPHMENFSDLASQLLAADGAVQVEDVPTLEAECARLLSAPRARATLAANGQRQLAAHYGAARRTAAELLPRAKLSTCQRE